MASSCAIADSTVLFLHLKHLAAKMPMLPKSDGDQAPAIGQQHDLEHDARVIGAGTGLIVAKTRIEIGQLQFVVDQVIERKLECAGLDLLAQYNGQEARAAIDGFVAG